MDSRPLSYIEGVGLICAPISRMCACVCLCVCVCVYAQVHVHVPVSVCVCECVCVFVFVFAYVCMALDALFVHVRPATECLFVWWHGTSGQYVGHPRLDSCPHPFELNICGLHLFWFSSRS